MPQPTNMTAGVIKALNKGPVHRVCPSCGFPLPVYPGRYPSKCPHCGESSVTAASNDDAADDGRADVE